MLDLMFHATIFFVFWHMALFITIIIRRGRNVWCFQTILNFMIPVETMRHGLARIPTTPVGLWRISHKILIWLLGVLNCIRNWPNAQFIRTISIIQLHAYNSAIRQLQSKGCWPADTLLASMRKVSIGRYKRSAYNSFQGPEIRAQNALD